MNITFLTQASVQDKAATQGNLLDRIGGSDRTESAKSDGTRKASTRAVDASFLAGTDGLRESLLGAGSMDDVGSRTQTLTELQQEASVTDVGVSQDYMTLMSNTMSTADFAEMCEEGFDFCSMDPDETVTIVDKIKAEMARSGEVVVGYTDDISEETLAAAVGSDSLAHSISESFRKADLPLTEANVSEIAAAWEQASQLTAPTEGSKQYLIENELAPEIWNLYLAQNSGASAAGNVTGDILAQNPGLAQQADRIIEQAGMEVDDQTRGQAQWLLERNLPLTAENLQNLKALDTIEFPVTGEVFAQAVAQAVSEGNTPIHADLTDGVSDDNRTIYEQAADILAQFTDEYERTCAQTTNVTARRQLEEVRLRMTAEVNVRLLRSGFSIDTAPMEQLIEALRQAEEDTAQSLFPDDDSAVTKYETWNETNRVAAELPAMPAQLLGTVRIEPTDTENATTLSEFHAEGKTLQAAYARANESYEALMTAPRADFGDSIRKAFANVDDILTDMNRELTPENQRAVRILGYNNMQITDKNIDRVKAADAQVTEVVQKLTPAATLQMIRDGVNPLEKSFAELNEYFAQNVAAQSETYEQESESYSKYLYGLERSGEITDEERESFVGVYRLLRQIEKGDGAAIGAVVNTRAELQFENLLSAVRSGRFRGTDVRVSDETGVLQELVRAGEGLSIDEQIESAYRAQQLERIRDAANVTRDAVSLLERGEMTATAENLIAAQELTNDPGAPFAALRGASRKIRGNVPTTETENVRAEDTVTSDEQIVGALSDAPDEETFRTAYTDFLDDLSAETEELTLQAGESLDVRALQTVHKQLSVLGSLAANEEYVVPMEIGGEEATVRLTFDHSGADRGSISVSVYSGENLFSEAHLQVQDGQLDGIFIGNTPDEVKNLGQAADIFTSRLENDETLDLAVGQLAVVSGDNTKETWMSETNSRGRDAAPDNGTLYRVAKLFLQTLQA